MLVLTRKPGERIYFVLPDGSKIAVMPIRTIGNKTSIGCIADDSVKIIREELMPGYSGRYSYEED
jgi:sRNA-binding carbon storage regulator CsrA